jgi:hypothetical protein
MPSRSYMMEEFASYLGAPLRASTSPDAQTVKGKKILKEPLAAREERAKTGI